MSSLSCPSCAAQLRVPAGAAPGKRFKCPKCGGVVTIPAAAAWSAPSAVPQAPPGAYDQRPPAPYRPPAPPAPAMAPPAEAMTAAPAGYGSGYGGYDSGYANPAPNLPEPGPSYQSDQPPADDALSQLAASAAPAAPGYAAPGYADGYVTGPQQGYAPQGYAPQAYAPAPPGPPVYQSGPGQQPGYSARAGTKSARKKGLPPVVLVLLIVGGVVLLGGLAGVGYLVFGRGIDSRLTKENFEQLKTGMTRQQVEDVMGKPTDEPGAMMGFSACAWSNHKDKTIVVWFQDDKVFLKSMVTGDAVNRPISPPTVTTTAPPAGHKGLFEGLTDEPAQPAPSHSAPSAKPPKSGKKPAR